MTATGKSSHGTHTVSSYKPQTQQHVTNKGSNYKDYPKITQFNSKLLNVHIEKEEHNTTQNMNSLCMIGLKTRVLV